MYSLELKFSLIYYITSKRMHGFDDLHRTKFAIKSDVTALRNLASIILNIIVCKEFILPVMKFVAIHFTHLMLYNASIKRMSFARC